MQVSPFLQVAAFVLMVLSSAMNIAAVIKLTGNVDKISNIFCIETPDQP
jgi:hypothetical protein